MNDAAFWVLMAAVVTGAGSVLAFVFDRPEVEALLVAVTAALYVVRLSLLLAHFVAT